MKPNPIHLHFTMFSDIATLLIEQLLPEIATIVSAAIMTAAAESDSEREKFLETIVQDALHKCGSKLSTSSYIDEKHMRSMLVSAISAIILSSSHFIDTPPHHSQPSEN